jgi:PhzF family phenazine biosynthesis protein
VTIEIVQIDAFADRPFSGNPAGVCLLDQPADPEWMQAVAAEMNLSETAFLVAVHGGWDLRWFSPTVEIDLCGHATIAAAHYLYEHRGVPFEPELVFFTASGELRASQTTDGWIALDFPSLEPEPATPPGALLEGLGLSDAVAVARSRLDFLVEVPSPDQVRELSPDMTHLRDIGTRGVVVTSVGDGLYDVVSRFFAPSVGVDEDPVTGSAHAVLGPYWAERLGKTSLLCFQASGRGGVVRVEVHDGRVTLAGQAITVLRAQLEGDAAEAMRRPVGDTAPAV